MANLSASFARVFRDVRRDHMPVQRYDIPSSDAPDTFLRRFWVPVNTPLHSETGQLIGALHHVEDVTAIVEPLRESRPSAPTDANTDQQTWNSLVTTLTREAHSHQQARATVTQLERALSSRIIIEQAKGMIAARENISTDQAFARLRRHARRNSALIHEIARAVVDLGLRV